jgi:Xaa-Pro aminopeptidase
MASELTPPGLYVPASEIEHRLLRIQEMMVQDGFEGALLFQNMDRFYFSGTMQPGILFLQPQGEPILFIRKNIDRAREESSLEKIVPLTSLRDLSATLLEMDIPLPQSLGLELDILPAQIYLQLETLFPAARLLDLTIQLRRCRMVKSSWEIENLRQAAKMTADLVRAVPSLLNPRLTELELAGRLESFLRSRGHQGFIRTRGFNQEVFYGHILSGLEGTRASYIDSPSGGLGTGPAFSQGAGLKVLRPQEPISIDYCGCYNGYIVDQTRMFSLGNPPAAVLEAYQAMLEVNELIKQRTCPGITGEQVYHWALEAAAQLGYGDYFMGFGATRAAYVGHGVGLELDELPLLAPRFDWPLLENTVFAFEPKVILPEMGLVGIENTFLLTQQGLEPLTTAPENFQVLTNTN